MDATNKPKVVFVRLDESKWEQIRIAAREAGVSINRFAADALARELVRRSTRKPAPQGAAK